jgi:hypothetical protein
MLSNRDNLVLVIVVSPVCVACKKAKDALAFIPDIFPQISFALLNTHTQFRALGIFKDFVDISQTPTFMLFKIGVFDRILPIPQFTKEHIRACLRNELDSKNIIPYKKTNSAYTKHGVM